MTIIIKKDQSVSEVEDAKKRIRKKANQHTLADYFGKLKSVYGDGVDFQKKLRDEWD